MPDLKRSSNLMIKLLLVYILAMSSLFGGELLFPRGPLVLKYDSEAWRLIPGATKSEAWGFTDKSGDLVASVMIDDVIGGKRGADEMVRSFAENDYDKVLLIQKNPESVVYSLARKNGGAQMWVGCSVAEGIVCFIMIELRPQDIKTRRAEIITFLSGIQRESKTEPNQSPETTSRTRPFSPTSPLFLIPSPRRLVYLL
jgi:hypothetical protein